MRANRLLIPALLLLSATPVFADGFIVVHDRRHRPRPRPQPMQGMFPLAVENHNVKVTIDGNVATTEIDQTFRNPLNQRLEGTYMFPLPKDAALDQFSMWIDGKEMKGELLDSQKALKIYTDIVRSMKDPALLEYAGRGMFKVRIFPIEPRSTKRVRLTYRQTLKANGGRVRYRYPLNTEKFSSQPLKQATIQVAIKSDTPIKGIYSPWHSVDVSRKGERTAVASWEAKNVKPNRDFVLDYDLAPGDVGMSIRTHAVPGRDGTFLLVVSPKVETGSKERIAKDVVFVFDTSGSMVGEKITQARKALKYMIARLNPDDRFAIVDYATDARVYKENLTLATNGEKAGAIDYVGDLVARGGTAIDEALQRAFAYRKSGSDRPFTVVFMTDGEPTIGEREPDRILGNLKKTASGKNARVFVWGVGNDLNADMLDRIAKDQRGDSYYVLPGEDIEVAMSTFYDKVASPALTDLKLSFTNVRVTDVYPRQLTDLFRGSQLLVVGRFKGEGAGAIRLTGKLNGVEKEFVYETKFERHKANPHVPRLWAKRKIGFLLEQIRLHGQSEELKKEVIRLARRHGLPTPYTSYLVLEEGAKNRLAGGAAPAPADEAMEGAMRRFRKEARKSSTKGFDRDAPAAPMKKGKDAVRQARLAGKLRRGGRADIDDDLGVEREVLERSIRTVEGRTFYRSNKGMWVESTVGKRKASWTKVEYLSSPYFALLKDNPDMGAVLALGRVIFSHEGKVYEIH